MTRLPVPGQDAGDWGDILNAFLLVEHNADGTLKLRSDGSLSVTKNDVGLGQVDNTSDLDKPVSTAMQAALTSLQSALASAQAALQNGVDGVEASLAVTQSDLATTRTDLAITQADVATVQTGIAGAQADIIALQTDLTTVQTNVASAQTSIGATQTDVTAIQAAVAGVQTTIGTVQTALSGKLDTTAVIGIAHGGTGATTVAGARAALGVTTWQAQDSGMLAWSFDPVAATSSQVVPAAGQLQCIRVPVAAGMVTNIILDVLTSGTNLQNCFAALYQNGTLLGQTNNQATAWQTSGSKIMPLTAPVAVQDGWVYVAFWANTSGGTLPAFTRGLSRPILNAALSTNYRSGATGSGITTTAPSSLGTLTPTNHAWWAGLS